MTHSPEPPPGRVETSDDGQRHAAAAAWCDEHDLADDAVRHALAAGDAAWAARLAERHLVRAPGYGEKKIVPSAAQLDVITDFRSRQQG